MRFTPMRSEPSSPDEQRSVVLLAAPVLDRHTYEALIHAAATSYVQGKRTLSIDLRQTVSIAQSGLFAIYVVHLIFQGEQPPSTEAGFRALRAVTDGVKLDGTQPVQLINVPANLVPLLARAGFHFTPA